MTKEQKLIIAFLLVLFIIPMTYAIELKGTNSIKTINYKETLIDTIKITNDENINNIISVYVDKQQTSPEIFAAIVITNATNNIFQQSFSSGQTTVLQYKILSDNSMIPKNYTVVFDAVNDKGVTVQLPIKIMLGDYSKNNQQIIEDFFEQSLYYVVIILSLIFLVLLYIYKKKVKA